MYFEIPKLEAKTNSCIVPIYKCIDAMHGKKFKELMQRTAEQFDNVHLILCDSLDAHNYTVKSNELWDEAIKICIDSATRWLKKHLPIVENAFLGQVKVTRWSELRNDLDFNKRYQLSQKLYDNNNEVRRYIHHICDHYVERASKRLYDQGHVPNKEKLLKMSINYTIEEVAGTATYNEWFGEPVVYLGEYFNDPQFFNRNNDIAPYIDMTLPAWCRVYQDESLKAVAA